MLRQRGQRHDLERGLVGCSHDDRRSTTIAIGQQPVSGGDTPAVAGDQAGKPVLRHRSTQIISDRLLVFEKLRSDHGTDRMQTTILRTAGATTIAVEARHRISAAGFERFTENVAISHPISITLRVVQRLSRRVADVFEDADFD